MGKREADMLVFEKMGTEQGERGRVVLCLLRVRFRKEGNLE